MASILDRASGQTGAPRGGLGRFSPPDWIFMPGAALLFAGLVALALAYEPAGEDPVVTDTQFIVNGPALAQLVPGPGTGVQLVTTGGEPAARMTATASLDAAGRLSAGVAAIIPAEFEAAVVGRVVKVEASMRAASGSDITEARLGYFTTGGGDSGWREVPVSSSFETVGFCYAVSPDAPLNEIESMGIWPDVDGGRRVLLVRDMRVTIQPEGDSVESCGRGLER